MKENVIKGTISAAFAALWVYLGQMLIPIAMLIVVLVLDYATGMSKAWMTKTLSSKVGFKGIVKKLGYLIVVCCGMGVDWIIHTAVVSAGVDAGAVYAVGIIVCVWLIINEIISILENLSIIGVPVPGFLIKIISKLKDSADKKIDRE